MFNSNKVVQYSLLD